MRLTILQMPKRANAGSSPTVKEGSSSAVISAKVRASRRALLDWRATAPLLVFVSDACATATMLMDTPILNKPPKAQ